MSYKFAAKTKQKRVQYLRLQINQVFDTAPTAGQSVRYCIHMAPEALAGNAPGVNQNYNGWDNVMVYNSDPFPTETTGLVTPEMISGDNGWEWASPWKVRQTVGQAYNYNHCAAVTIEPTTSPW